ncbi:serine/threonine protein kinase [Microbacterium sp. Ru50]|uniref:class III lanthionine synthetase LanKC n=1 Tax=Microbacterium sp. Ru50 TaxID=2080744 RepID=UPI000CDDF21E|nr:class III lanthionine synthetase LanKC [Microbacterium sp. Ru50]POX67663.1 serine/threonine protein kinase [Microbacterium sp. Ru50]
MDPIFGRFAIRDRVFYDSPGTDAARAGAPEDANVYAPSTAVPWDGWRRSRRHPWSIWLPPGMRLAAQGWKVHVTALPDGAGDVLDIVSAYCHRHGIPFKHLIDERALDAVLAKDAERSGAGKFITLYPPSEESLEHCLGTLDEAVGSRPGPYILSDLRWNVGPLFVRYGAFTDHEVLVDGESLPAVRDLRSGQWVPDRREAGFHVPPWVELPTFLRRQLDALGDQPPAGFPEITGALHYSNAGGVYRGFLDGSPVIVKEARPFAGWTPDGRDAVARLQDEERTLRAVAGRVRVPEVRASLDAHGHRFLVLEQLPGQPLDRVVSTSSPLTAAVSTAAERHAYRDRMLRVVDALGREISRLHAAGLTHGDLHPANVVVDADGSVGLIDFEMSMPVGSRSAAVLGAAGFTLPDEPDPVRRDAHALACIELYVFLPLTSVLALQPAKAGALAAEAAAAFDLPRAWSERMAAALRLGSRGDGAPGQAGRHPQPGPTIERIAAQLIADATPHRRDRLWPGDPRQFAEPAFSLAHGALGVALALDAAGVALPSEMRAWVSQSISAVRDDRPRVGLMDGLAGAVWACRRLGLTDEATTLGERLQSVELDVGAWGSDLASGLAGIGIALLDASGSPDDLARAIDIVDRLSERWGLDERSAPMTTPPASRRRGGLMGGASGTALLAVRLFEHTRDRRFLEIARHALAIDLGSLRRDGDGSLQVDQGWRLLPYLAHGSAGIGLVLAQYLAHEPDDELDDALRGIIRAASAPFVVQSGIFAGRAGLALFLHSLHATGHATPETVRARDHHLSRMTLHALDAPAGVRIVGDGMLRASCDLATGAAGVLLTLVAASGRGPVTDRPLLPILPPVLAPVGSPAAIERRR